MSTQVVVDDGMTDYNEDEWACAEALTAAHSQALALGPTSPGRLAAGGISYRVPPPAHGACDGWEVRCSHHHRSVKYLTIEFVL